MLSNFSFEKTEIDGLVKINPFVSIDARGSFVKDYSYDVFEKNGLPYELKEVFYTSSRKGCIRAIHFQREKTQPKLVRCVSGRIFDVVVDLRKGSNTFGKWAGFYLTGENNTELLIPGQCGHGYIVIEPSIVSYKCSERFYGEYDDGILWNDKQLNIAWPLNQIDEVILSEKDGHLQSFSDFVDKYKGL